MELVVREAYGLSYSTHKTPPLELRVGKNQTEAQDCSRFGTRRPIWSVSPIPVLGHPAIRCGYSRASLWHPTSSKHHTVLGVVQSYGVFIYQHSGPTKPRTLLRLNTIFGALTGQERRPHTTIHSHKWRLKDPTRSRKAWDRWRTVDDSLGCGVLHR
jgi:hypothetical protein